MADAREQRRSRFRGAYLAILLLAMTASGCLERQPVLVVSTREIDFGTQLSLASFTVRNAGKDGLLTAGVAPLEYRISADREWLTITPASGSCGGGRQNTHAVAVDRSLLLVGNNIATVTISSNDGPWTILVRADNDVSTCSDPPTAPWNPAPGDGATGVPTGAALVWNDGVSRCPGLSATYDVYFGATSPPPFAHDNGASKSWNPGTLANGTTYYWRIVAKDANGSTSGAEWRFTTTAAPCTAAPAAVALVAPGNGATSVSVDQNLSWGSGDSQCPGLTATYDVRFGTTSPPPFARDNGSSKTWDPGTLAYGTTYYWQVVAKDANGSTSGPVWSFTTSAAPCTAAPAAVALVAPGNGATSVSIDQNLSWGGGDSQCPGLTATYDVRFGTTSPPPFDHDNGSSKSWDPGPLAYVTTYYWQVVAKDANGSTPGPVWSFTTEAPCLALPTAACTPLPADGAVNINENTDLAWGCGASQCVGLVPTYDVYFGTSPTPGPAELLGNTASRTWVLPRQLKNTTYYWQVVTKDANGSTPGPVWSFRTRT